MAIKKAKDRPTRRAERERESYANAYVTFLDILGFRDIVSKRTAHEVARLIRLTRFFSADEAGEQAPVGLSTIAFSDSVVRIRKADAVSGLFHELLDLLHAQSELVAQGVVVRGGVTFGKIIHEEDRVFGPALVQAYDLESKFANYPRIVVDPKLLTALCAGKLPMHNELSWEIGYVMDLLRPGDDGIYFIDYLGAFLRELDDPPSQFPEFLDKHRGVIAGLAKQIRKSGGTLSPLAVKANWMASYHNAVIAEFQSGSSLPSELAITSEDLPTLFVPPPFTRHEDLPGK